MKKKLSKDAKFCVSTLLAAVLLTATIWAQTPQSFKYQAVARDASGEVVANQAVGMQISILQGSTSGTAVYVETFMPTTNEFGLINLNIGAGTVVSGDFTTIDWSADTYFMKVEMDITGGTTYEEYGTSQLLSVPYAMHAKTAANIFSGNYNDLSGAPINVSTFTNDAGYLTSYSETDPVFVAHISSGISASDTSNWITAYGWGDHSTAGYLTDLTGHNVTELADISDAGSGIVISSTERTKLSGIETGADVTDATNVNAAGAVMEADFNAGTFLYATSDNTPQPKTVAETKTILSLENVENTALSNWAGSGNITSLGTVTSGTLSTGAALADVTMSLGSDADGDVYYRSGSKLTRLPIGTNDQVLTLESGVPAWKDASGGSSGHYVGELFGGGIVYYVYDIGQHGLIASLDDLDGGSGVAWSATQSTLIGATAQSFYDGASNTVAIVAQDNTAGYAATLCDSYSNGGFSDWYLPASWELNLLYNSAFMINKKLENDGDGTTNGFNAEYVSPTHGRYWSSTENSSSNAWYYCFYFGRSNSNYGKPITYRVRAVRAF